MTDEYLNRLETQAIRDGALSTTETLNLIEMARKRREFADKIGNAASAILKTAAEVLRILEDFEGKRR